MRRQVQYCIILLERPRTFFSLEITKTTRSSNQRIHSMPQGHHLQFESFTRSCDTAIGFSQSEKGILCLFCISLQHVRLKDCISASFFHSLMRITCTIKQIGSFSKERARKSTLHFAFEHADHKQMYIVSHVEHGERNQL